MDASQCQWVIVGDSEHLADTLERFASDIRNGKGYPIQGMFHVYNTEHEQSGWVGLRHISHMIMGANEA